MLVCGFRFRVPAVADGSTVYLIGGQSSFDTATQSYPISNHNLAAAIRCPVINSDPFPVWAFVLIVVGGIFLIASVVGIFMMRKQNKALKYALLEKSANEAPEAPTAVTID